MISADNKPLNSTTSDSDFTSEHYRQLCQLAIKNYSTASYLKVPWGQRFVLWRHDMDYSLNRGLSLAKIEHEYGIKATYFLNLHSEFYNLAEASQHAIIKQIISLGHDIGLHFDASFFGDISESELNHAIAREAGYLKSLFNIQPVAFSFHNPVAHTLNFESDTYGGLLNCYSTRFKTEVPYTSDSNGYWRYRRLHDVLRDATDPCLQVLTHPGWWQEKPMSPRQRIYRSALGRTLDIMRTYDEALMRHGRLNHMGASKSLLVIKAAQPVRFQLCEYLWNQGEFYTLFVELWRIHEAQINRLCKAQFLKEWGVPLEVVNEFFSNENFILDGWQLFCVVFGDSWENVIGTSMAEYRAFHTLGNQIIHARSMISSTKLEDGCVAICSYIGQMSQWALSHPFSYSGLTTLDTIDFSILDTNEECLDETLDVNADERKCFNDERWRAFIDKISEAQKLQARISKKL